MLALLADIAHEPMFLLLLACGGVYLMLGDRKEALMLLGFVGMVITITYVQRRRSEGALEALRELSSPRALVLRDGRLVRVASRELVVGDVVLLAEGERVPADLQLIETSTLSVDESLLTGESVPVLKHAADGPADAPPDPLAQVFSGTLVTQGNGRGWVHATGERSALGRIGASLRTIEAERTPVQQETQRIVTQVVATLGLTLAGLLAVAWGISRGEWLPGLLAGLTLAMAVLPEELPVVLTIFLGIGAWRLAREGVLCRSMPAQERLGACTVLCVDKTGTLTLNRMAVRQLWANGQAHTAGRQQPARPARELACGAGIRGAGQPPARLRPDGAGHCQRRAAAAGGFWASACRLETGGGLPARARAAGPVARLAVARAAGAAGGRQGSARGRV